VKLVLAVDAIIPPLTGIGRYAWELARHYSQLDDARDDFQYLFVNELVADPSQLLDKNWRKRSRGTIAKFLRPPASARRWNLQRKIKRCLLHSPNYFLPEIVDRGVVTIHDLSVFKYPDTHPVERIRQFERRFASTLKKSEHLITDSEAIRVEVAEYFGWDKNRITAIPLGVPREFRPYGEFELAEPLSRYGLVAGRYCLCVSTLEPRKRIDRLLDAYADLPAMSRARFPLVLAGSKGWLNEQLEAKIELGEAQGWLRYLGFVPEPDLPFLYAGAHAFFFPSLYEGFGLPILEALASGVPTLTSSSSSLPEVAGGAAWLVAPDDHDDLKDGLEKVMFDDDWRTSARRRGLEVAAKRTWQECAQRTLGVCRQFA
jgi:alpha-1,3-rhamnosyl/mannosyltransferase